MITEFNTTAPAPSMGPAPVPGATGGSDKTDKLIMVAVVLVAGYFAYKYLIQKPAEKEIEDND